MENLVDFVTHSRQIIAMYNPEALKHFESIVSFLKQFQKILREEPLQNFPNHKNDYPESWMNYLLELSNEDFFQITGELNANKIQLKELKDFHFSIRELKSLPRRKLSPSPKLPGLRLEGITAKKLHEIAQITNFLQVQWPKGKLVDVCSGKGHLSYFLAHEYDRKTLNIDIDSELQVSGDERNEKYLKPLKKKENVLFKTLNLEELNSKVLEGYDYSLGLHTCGGLATHHLENSTQSNLKGVLNFGCCYHKMTPSHYHISGPGKKAALIDHKYSLTLATRSHAPIKKSVYDMNFRVKQYRYIFQFFLREKLSYPMDTILKSSKTSLYKGEFSHYAKEQLKRLNIKKDFSDQELNNFYNRPLHHQWVKEILATSAIRNLLGRLIEIYLLYDRAFYLNEKGYETNLVEFFDEELSPRNIGIIAEKVSPV